MNKKIEQATVLGAGVMSAPIAAQLAKVGIDTVPFLTFQVSFDKFIFISIPNQHVRFF
jgi:3-hydroxyacyl-CoA dehydrogenase